MRVLLLSVGVLSKYVNLYKRPGPSCSKVTTSLVKDSLKFTSSDTQIY